jgi:hypothetical protein
VGLVELVPPKGTGQRSGPTGAPTHEEGSVTLVLHPNSVGLLRCGKLARSMTSGPFTPKANALQFKNAKAFRIIPAFRKILFKDPTQLRCMVEY